MLSLAHLNLAKGVKGEGLSYKLPVIVMEKVRDWARSSWKQY